MVVGDDTLTIVSSMKFSEKTFSMKQEELFSESFSPSNLR